MERADRPVAPDPDAGRRPDDDRAPRPAHAVGDITYCFLGDGRNNVARSLLVTGALLGMDVRDRRARASFGHPPTCVAAAPQRSRRTAAPGSRSPTTSTTRCRGADFIYTDVWVSMGESDDEWAARVPLLTAVPGHRGTHGRPPAGRTPGSCTACRPSTTRTPSSGAAVARAVRAGRRRGHRRGLRVPASVVFDQAENRMHTIKALLVAALAG